MKLDSDDLHHEFEFLVKARINRLVQAASSGSRHVESSRYAWERVDPIIADKYWLRDERGREQLSPPVSNEQPEWLRVDLGTADEYLLERSWEHSEEWGGDPSALDIAQVGDDSEVDYPDDDFLLDVSQEELSPNGDSRVESPNTTKASNTSVDDISTQSAASKPSSPPPEELPIGAIRLTASDDDDVPIWDPPDIRLGDTLADFRRRAALFPLLTAAEEVELARRIEAGLFAREALEGVSAVDLRTQHCRDLLWVARHGDRAFERMLKSNLRLAMDIARRHQGQGLELLDLIQEGSLGLIRAIYKFDYTKGFKFSTYATWWIRQAITRAIADKGRTIRLPVHLHSELAKFEEASTSLLGRPPALYDLETLSATLELPLEQVHLLYRSSLSIESLDRLNDHFGWDLPDSSETRLDDALTAFSLRDKMRVLLDSMSEREADVIRKRYGLEGGSPMTLDQIGDQYGLTRERIRQIEKSTMDKLKHPSRSESLRSFL